MGPEAIPGIPKRGRIAEAPAVLLLLNVEQRAEPPRSVGSPLGEGTRHQGRVYAALAHFGGEFAVE
jgi:hypothetical protein